MFFYKVEGHIPKLSSFGQGKTIRPKKSLTSLLHAALQLRYTWKAFFFLVEAVDAHSNEAPCKTQVLSGLP